MNMVAHEECPLGAIVTTDPKNRSSFLERHLEAWQRVDPVLHAFVPGTVRPGELRNTLERVRADEPHAPLTGVFFAVKDIISVDGLPRTGGSRFNPTLLAGREASVVTRLRSLGALPFGMSVSTEFAWFHPGPTANPHNLRHTPGGSSSGSAAAVAAGVVPLAIGTQTIGSVIRPASFCGIVGYKPTQGLLPRDGLLSVSVTMDHPGFFTQDLDGMAALAALLFGGEHTALHPGDPEPAVTFCTGAYLLQAEDQTISAMRDLAARLRAEGYSVEEMELFSPEELIDLSHAHRAICAREFFHAHHRRFTENHHLYHESTAAFFREGEAVHVEQYAAALELREWWIAQFDRRESTRVFMSPAAPGPAPSGLHTTGNPVMNLPWTFLGAPALTMPFHWFPADGSSLPAGIQLTTSRFHDIPLFRAAQAMAPVL